jgi:hypothetical protein
MRTHPKLGSTLQLGGFFETRPPRRLIFRPSAFGTSFEDVGAVELDAHLMNEGDVGGRAVYMLDCLLGPPTIEI